MFKWIKNLFVAPEPTGERAKDEQGRFVADDPSTPNVNEAYVDGKTPAPKKKRTYKRRTTTKKAPAGAPTTAKKAPAKRAPRKKKTDV